MQWGTNTIKLFQLNLLETHLQMEGHFPGFRPPKGHPTFITWDKCLLAWYLDHGGTKLCARYQIFPVQNQKRQTESKGAEYVPT